MGTRMNQEEMALIKREHFFCNRRERGGWNPRPAELAITCHSSGPGIFLQTKFILPVPP